MSKVITLELLFSLMRVVCGFSKWKELYSIRSIHSHASTEIGFGEELYLSYLCARLFVAPLVARRLLQEQTRKSFQQRRNHTITPSAIGKGASFRYGNNISKQ